MKINSCIFFRWITQNCENAKYILRSDDDQAIDTHHLPIFLDNFIDMKDNKNDNFYLCYSLNDAKPKRDPNSKWYVSKEDYADESYPEYCCGWAYVTNVATMKNILGKRSSLS